VVILSLDLVGGGNAELLGLLVSPPIVAASFVGPKRTEVVGQHPDARLGNDFECLGDHAVAGERAGPAYQDGRDLTLADPNAHTQDRDRAARRAAALQDTVHRGVAATSGRGGRRR
jgi:hypothetical protein